MLFSILQKNSIEDGNYDSFLKNPNKSDDEDIGVKEFDILNDNVDKKLKISDMFKD